MSPPVRGGGPARILYLSYDGMTDDIGQSQVLPYLLGCAAAGHRITLVSFEKADRLALHGGAVEALLKDCGIDWRPERFRSFPPLLAKVIDQHMMVRAARRALRQGAFDLVHARSYIAGRGALAAMTVDDRFLFDMRGFWVDQRREGGRWRDSSLLGRLLYRRWKSLEARMIARADHVVTLAEAARRRIAQMPAYRGQPVSIIPCCADFALFPLATTERRATARAMLGIPETSLVIAWLGSLGTVYRPALQFRLFDKARGAYGDVRLVFIGRHDKDDLMAQAAAAGVTLAPDELVIRACARDEVPDMLAAADLGSCFIVPGGSSAGVSPTKLGEMLACGLPVIANAGVGDVEEQIARIGGGVTLSDDSDAAIERAVAAIPALLAIDRARLREKARKVFDVPYAIAAYDQLYRDLATARTALSQ